VIAFNELRWSLRHETIVRVKRFIGYPGGYECEEDDGSIYYLAEDELEVIEE
jgi:hypothetical protein